MKIIYIGCVESSYFFLEALLEAGANVIGVITKKNQNIIQILKLYLRYVKNMIFQYFIHKI